MRVLQLGKFYPILGGVEKVIYKLTTGISKHGINCDMLCTCADGNKLISLNPISNILCCGSRINLASTTFSISLIYKLQKICNSYDIIHIHHPDPMAALALLLSRYKGKVVLHWHSDILKQKRLLLLYKPIQNWLIKRACIIVGTSPVYVKKSPFLQNVQNKITYIPIGINQISPIPSEVNKIKELYSNKKIILSIGRLVEYKGYEHLIDSAKFLPDDYLILIAGDGPLRGALKSQIKEKHLDNKVKLLGYISNSDKYALYGACKVFCMSSVLKTEAFGIVQIEAMSCKRPVVATNIPESGVPWVNYHGISGLNVEPGEPEKLAKAFTTICEDDTLYERLSNQAFARYKQLFQKEDMIKKCITLYKYILSQDATDKYKLYEPKLS